MIWQAAAAEAVKRQVEVLPAPDFDKVTTAYKDFLASHDKPGSDVLKPLNLQRVTAEQVLEKINDLSQLIKTNPEYKAVHERQKATLTAFVEKLDPKTEVLFSQNGTWYIPNLVREVLPQYKQDLLLSGKEVAGTAALSFGENHPFPAYDKETGEQIGGYEKGAKHGWLATNNFLTGLKKQFHQTFLENSSKDEFRPGIASVNDKHPDNHLLGMEPNAAIQDKTRKLDDVGMLKWGHWLVNYVCEIITDPQKAANWDGDTRFANFNYIMRLALRFKLNRAQMEVMELDGLLAESECRMLPEPGTTITDQNAPGFKPKLKAANYPDGTPRYVHVIKHKHADGEETKTFKNATQADFDAAQATPLPENESILRVMEYETAVPADKMQMVEPYNHYGGKNVRGVNCLGAAANFIYAVAGHGSATKPILAALGFKDRLGPEAMLEGLQNLITGSWTKNPLNAIARAKVRTKETLGQAVNVFRLQTEDGLEIDLVDFMNVRRFGWLSLKEGAQGAVKKMREEIRKMSRRAGPKANSGDADADEEDEEDMKAHGFTGYAISKIAELRAKYGNDNRPPEEEMKGLCFGVDYLGTVLDQVEAELNTPKSRRIAASLRHYAGVIGTHARAALTIQTKAPTSQPTPASLNGLVAAEMAKLHAILTAVGPQGHLSPEAASAFKSLIANISTRLYSTHASDVTQLPAAVQAAAAALAAHLSTAGVNLDPAQIADSIAARVSKRVRAQARAPGIVEARGNRTAAELAERTARLAQTFDHLVAAQAAHRAEPAAQTFGDAAMDFAEAFGVNRYAPVYARAFKKQYGMSWQEAAHGPNRNNPVPVAAPAPQAQKG